MNDETWIEAALMAVLQARKRACSEGRSRGARWLLECRDLWDFAKMDGDAGIYFLYATTEQEVDALIARYAEDRFNTIDGIFDLELAPDEYDDIAPEDWLSGTRAPRRRPGGR